jgi:hypothetical protein
MRAPRASLIVMLLVPGFAWAEGCGELGTLERGAVDAALAARGLAIDRAPEGKIVGFIHVVNLEVFQLNAEVLRCDWGFPWRSYRNVHAGWPGRISCGFRQVF